MISRAIVFAGTLLILAGSAILAVGALLALYHWAPSWLLIGVALMLVGGLAVGVEQ